MHWNVKFQELYLYAEDFMKNKTRTNIWLLLVLVVSLCALSCITSSQIIEAETQAKEPAAKVQEKPSGPKEVTRNGVSKHNGYTYEFWSQNGLGDSVMTLRDGCTFDITWSGIFNLLARIGLRPGLDTKTVTYNVENYSVTRGLSSCLWTAAVYVQSAPAREGTAKNREYPAPLLRPWPLTSSPL